MTQIQLYQGDGFEVAREAGVRVRGGIRQGRYVIREARHGTSVHLTAEQWAQLATWLNPRGVQI
jgi:hypothetical protein